MISTISWFLVAFYLLVVISILRVENKKIKPSQFILMLMGLYYYGEQISFLFTNDIGRLLNPSVDFYISENDYLFNCILVLIGTAGAYLGTKFYSLEYSDLKNINISSKKEKIIFIVVMAFAFSIYVKYYAYYNYRIENGFYSFYTDSKHVDLVGYLTRVMSYISLTLSLVIIAITRKKLYLNISLLIILSVVVFGFLIGLRNISAGLIFLTLFIIVKREFIKLGVVFYTIIFISACAFVLVGQLRIDEQLSLVSIFDVMHFTSVTFNLPSMSVALNLDAIEIIKIIISPILNSIPGLEGEFVLLSRYLAHYLPESAVNAGYSLGTSFIAESFLTLGYLGVFIFPMFAMIFIDYLYVSAIKCNSAFKLGLFLVVFQASVMLWRESMLYVAAPLVKYLIIIGLLYVLLEIFLSKKNYK